MVSILDNKKISQLVIENTETESGYEKINPKSLATIIYEDHGEEPGTITDDVQQHIDDESIHFNMNKVKNEIGKSFLKINNVLAGDGVNIVKDNTNKTVTISSTIQDLSSYMKIDSLVPEDETITLTPFTDQETEKLYVRANVPDVSRFITTSNIIPDDDSIIIRKDNYSNNVYFKTNPISYVAGDGLKIVDGVITNTKPDKIVGLTEGDNITIDGVYPDFTISARNKLNVTPWQPNFRYVYGDVIIHNKGIYYCIVSSTQKAAFDSEDWQIIADYKMTRYDFVTGDEPTRIINLKKDPEDPESKGLVEPINDTDTLILNVGGIIPISDTYTVKQDGFTIEFDEPIPANTPIEVMILGHSVLNEQDPTANINEWEPNVLYEVGNIVIYQDALYRCIERHPSEEEFDNDKWHILMSYTKDVYTFLTDSETTSIYVPANLDDKRNISINVGNTILLQDAFNIEDDKHTITFNYPIDSGINIEVTVYTHGVMNVPEVPSPRGRKDMMIISDNLGEKYELVSLEDLIRKLGFETLSQISEHSNSVIGVNETGTDYEFLPYNNLSGKLGIRNTTNGFDILNYDEIENQENRGMVTFAKGSTLSDDESVLMTLYINLTKNLFAKWENGNNKGSLLDAEYQDLVFEQPILSPDNPLNLRVTTTSEQSDREGWRAMDAFETTGNGWQTAAGVTSAIWQYANDDPLKITKFKFRNQKYYSEMSPMSKNVEIWASNDSSSDLINKEKIILGRFQAYNNSTQVSEVTIQNPIYGKVFGFTVLDSQGGNSVGALDIKMEGYVASHARASDKIGYIYVISNDDGTAVDIATTYCAPGTVNLLNMLPQGFTKYKQIGIFETNDSGDLLDVYPHQDLNKFYINREFVNQEQLNRELEVFSDQIDEKVEEAIEEKGVYTKAEIDEKFELTNDRLVGLNENKVDKTSDANKLYGTDSNGNQITYDASSVTGISDVKVNGTSVVNGNVANITLGSMATKNSGDYSTKAVADTLYAPKSTTYTKTEIDNKVETINSNIATKMNTNDFNTKFDARFNSKIVYRTKSQGLPENPDSNTFYFIQA